MKYSVKRNPRDIESRRVSGHSAVATRVHGIPFAVLLALLGAVMAQSTIANAQPAARSFSMKVIGDQCIEFTDVEAREYYRECRVSEFGEFGAVGDQIYYYTIYCLMPNETDDNGKCGDDSSSAKSHRAEALAVFARDPASENARLIFDRISSDIGLAIYKKPQIIQNPAGTLLYLPIVLSGTGHGNESEYYLRGTNDWEPIEATGWLADLRKRLPAGLAIWKGVWPDLHTMQARASLYRAGDANCCPTGGAAEIRLAIRAGQFVIDSLVVDTTASPE